MSVLQLATPRTRRRYAARTLARFAWLFPVLVVALCAPAWAQGYSAWVRSVNINGPQQFNIYDRTTQALVQNPVYRHYDLAQPAQDKPAGVVHSTPVTLQADLDGVVPVGAPVWVYVYPFAFIGDNYVSLTETGALTLVSQWSDPDTADLSFTFNAPYGVGKREMYIYWYVWTSDDGGQTWVDEAGDFTLHTFYTTLARPIVSQAVGAAIKGNPWIEMLERSAVWAQGLDNDVAIMQALTPMLWANSMHIYDGGQHSTSGFDQLDVNRFLTPSLDIQADCRDMSNFLALLGRSLGLNVTTLRIRGGTTGLGNFWTQYLGPHTNGEPNRQPAAIIRSTGQFLGNSLNHTWTQTRWNYHQVAQYGGILYDACAKVERQPFVPRNPSTIINHRNLRPAEAAQIGFAYIPPGDYQPNREDFLLGSTYAQYQPLLVLNEAPFTAASHIEVQGQPPVVR